MKDNVTHLPLLRHGHPSPRLEQLARSVGQVLDSAELFAYSLDGENLAEEPQRAAYLLGLAEAHIISLVSIIRAVKR